MFTERAVWIVALGVILGSVGCSAPGSHLPVGSYERGQAEIEGEIYPEAIETLKLFIRRSPTDERADNAQFAVGEAYMAMEDFPVAAVEFEILRADYPNSELFDEAFFMEGMCYVEQVPPVHLDQAVTTKAVNHFERLLRERPTGVRAPDAEAEVTKLRKHLDKKRLRGVRLYMDLKRWSAAQTTLDALMVDRPESPLRPDMLLDQARIARALEDEAQWQSALTELIERYPDHEAVADARNQLNRESR